ncbi:DUF3021 family protein [Anaerosporobacter faecicola]|uniref:DUF3021 family protein n=1 Tax=Anaerosporobacter faecicola TaxID=2718714 RepID=UPI00143C471B|nr:DUF3021 family protein [Anaerosporobacter faecicola]
MKLSQVLSNMIRNFFVIFGIIIIGTAILNPDFIFTSEKILLVTFMAFATDCVNLIYWSRKELSERERNVRRILHFILIEVIVLTFGNVFAICSGWLETIIFGAEIMVIYVLVCVIDWLLDRKTANQINEKLRLLKSENQQ